MTAGGVGHPDYHDAGDDTAKIDAEMLRKNGQFVLQGVDQRGQRDDRQPPDPRPPAPLQRHAAEPAQPGRGQAAAAAMFMMGPQGIIGQSGPQGPRFGLSLSDVSAFGGNVALIDVTAKVMNVGRVEVPAPGRHLVHGQRPDRPGQGRAEGVRGRRRRAPVPQPVRALPRRPARQRDEGIHRDGPGHDARRSAGQDDLVEKNALLTRGVRCWLHPQAVSRSTDRVEEGARRLGQPAADDARTPGRLVADGRRADVAAPEDCSTQAKQQVYLALVKAGWTRTRSTAMVGVNPPMSGPMQMPPPPGTGRLGGNLGKLGG